MLVRIIDPHEESLETPLGNSFKFLRIFIILELYYAINVDLKKTSAVIELLNEIFPMENSRHLKRIRKIKDDSKKRMINGLNLII
jgi:hypothetical protein